ncbi:hypothetical protein CCZ01_06690 [Helicobacter monodelphidis]|uniref:hypothetical protein n=1 Tax=Helicobacter sp. 15-1451 TaxID=2004995 RepID=UPI000DCB3868|nr:hypothetical protein [Helicobacter sp. 15-1451]RAX57259.1 hypothetical protein CCZ01_06690 [Helicobacter sp. 15-1451]
MNKEASFNIYRYQILPRDRIEFSLFDEIQNVEQLIENKNKILQQILESLETRDFRHRQYPIKFQLKYNLDNFLIFKLDVKRVTKIGNEDLEDTEHDDWRYIFIIFWNHPDKQFLLIQDKVKVFNDIKVSHTRIMKILEQSLLEKQLVIKSESLFDKSEFWNIVNLYPDKISRVRFNLITPNMANISSALSKDLKNLFKATNTTESSLEIKSAEQSKLHLQQGDDLVEDMVDYASNGGGSINIKVKGIKKVFKTTDKYKSIAIDEITLNADKQESITKAINDLEKLLDNL